MNSSGRSRAWPLSLAVIALLLFSMGRVPNAYAMSDVSHLAADIASLPYAQGNSCQSVISIVQDGGQIEQDMNQALGTDFQPVLVDARECSLLVSFIPIVGSYDDLVVAAQQYNSNNETSVKNFYVKLFVLAAETTVIGIALDDVLYKVSFRTTGELNDALKMGKLQSICGDECYSEALGATYGFINGTASSLVGSFMQWAASYIPIKDLPSICSWPIIGWIYMFFNLPPC